MNQVVWIIATKKKLARLKRSRCYICQKSFGKGFVFHHRYYDGGEPDFSDKSKYWTYVFKQIKNTPGQFYLLCNPHHHLISTYGKMSDPKWRRVNKVRKDSK